MAYSTKSQLKLLNKQIGTLYSQMKHSLNQKRYVVHTCSKQFNEMAAAYLDLKLNKGLIEDDKFYQQPLY